MDTSFFVPGSKGSNDIKGSPIFPGSFKCCTVSDIIKPRQFRYVSKCCKPITVKLTHQHRHRLNCLRVLAQHTIHYQFYIPIRCLTFTITQVTNSLTGRKLADSPSTSEVVNNTRPIVRSCFRISILFIQYSFKLCAIVYNRGIQLVLNSIDFLEHSYNLTILSNRVDLRFLVDSLLLYTLCTRSSTNRLKLVI